MNKITDLVLRTLDRAALQMRQRARRKGKRTNPAYRMVRSAGIAVRTLVQSRNGRSFGRVASWREGSEDLHTEQTWLERYFDAHDVGPGIWKWRHYFPIYERHLSKFRGREVHLVEIGIYSGGSLEMWRSYLGDKAHIYGVDIAPECRAYEAEGIRIFIGDQSDRNFWEAFKAEVPRIDVVIDDGGHQSFQQIATLESLLPALDPGGVYLCEDIHSETNQFSDYLFGMSRNLNSIPKEFTKQAVGETTPFQRHVDSFHLYPYVAVIERRQHPLGCVDSARQGTQWQPPGFWEAARRTRDTK